MKKYYDIIAIKSDTERRLEALTFYQLQTLKSKGYKIIIDDSYTINDNDYNSIAIKHDDY